MAVHTLTLTADRETRLGELATAAGITTDVLISNEADSMLDKEIDRKYCNWFGALDIATKKTIYDANQ